MGNLKSRAGKSGEGKSSEVDSGRIVNLSEGCEGGRRGKKEPQREKRDNTYLILELWVSANKLMIDIAGQVLEAEHRKSSKLLASLISLRMEIFTDREKRD